MQQIISRYLKQIETLNRSPHTIKNYRKDLEKFNLWRKYVRKKPLILLNAKDISLYQAFLKEGGTIESSRSLFNFIQKRPKQVIFYQKPLSIASQQRHLSSLANFLEFLQQTSALYSLFWKIRRPIRPILHQIKLKDVDVKHTITLKPDHWEQLRQIELSIEEKLMLSLLYYGGLRLNELRTLEKDSFDFTTNKLFIKRKGGYTHNLAIQKSELIATLWKYHITTLRTDCPYLFVSNRRQQYGEKALYNKINKLLSRANCPAHLSPHSFRKACATNLYHETKDLLLVRDYLNHKDAKVTQSYIEN